MRRALATGILATLVLAGCATEFDPAGYTCTESVSGECLEGWTCVEGVCVPVDSSDGWSPGADGSAGGGDTDGPDTDTGGADDGEDAGAADGGAPDDSGTPATDTPQDGVGADADGPDVGPSDVPDASADSSENVADGVADGDATFEDAEQDAVSAGDGGIADTTTDTTTDTTSPTDSGPDETAGGDVAGDTEAGSDVAPLLDTAGPDAATSDAPSPVDVDDTPPPPEDVLPVPDAEPEVVDPCAAQPCIPGVTPAQCFDSQSLEACVPDDLGCGTWAQPVVCNDDDPCTEGEGCSDGACHPGDAVECGGDDPCLDYGACGDSGCPEPVSVECEDGDLCTLDTCDPVSGECGATAVVCDDQDPCTNDGCSPDGECNYLPKDCDDGDLCTENLCDDTGQCVHPAVNCDDGDACTIDTCEAPGGCQQADLECDDGAVCTVDGCDPELGCVDAPLDCGVLDCGGPAPSADCLDCEFEADECNDEECPSLCRLYDFEQPELPADWFVSPDQVQPTFVVLDDGSALHLHGGDDPFAARTDVFPKWTLHGDFTIEVTGDVSSSGDESAFTHCKGHIGFKDCSAPAGDSEALWYGGQFHPQDYSALLFDPHEALGTSNVAFRARLVKTGSTLTMAFLEDGDWTLWKAFPLGADPAPLTFWLLYQGFSSTCTGAMNIHDVAFCTCEVGPCDCSGESCTLPDAECDDGDHTTSDAWDPVGGCMYEPIVCDDDNPCTSDSVGLDGLCVFEELEQVCQVCDPADGAWSPAPDGTPCQDGNACTEDDGCAEGLCVAGPTVVCNDDDSPTCTVDTCDPATGCVFEAAACKRMACSGGVADVGPWECTGCSLNADCDAAGCGSGCRVYGFDDNQQPPDWPSPGFGDGDPTYQGSNMHFEPGNLETLNAIPTWSLPGDFEVEFGGNYWSNQGVSSFHFCKGMLRMTDCSPPSGLDEQIWYGEQHYPQATSIYTFDINEVYNAVSGDFRGRIRRVGGTIFIERFNTATKKWEVWKEQDAPLPQLPMNLWFAYQDDSSGCSGGMNIFAVSVCMCGDGECDCTGDECSLWPQDCDDADPCTDDTWDHLIGCVNTPVVCPADAYDCTVDACDPATGECASTLSDDGFCLIDDACHDLGAVNPADDCEMCLEGDPFGWQTAPDRVGCDDGDPCTEQNNCLAGVCVGSPVDCSDLIGGCWEAECVSEAGGCVISEKVEGDACHVDACAVGGVCSPEGQCEQLSSASWSHDPTPSFIGLGQGIGRPGYTTIDLDGDVARGSGHMTTQIRFETPLDAPDTTHYITGNGGSSDLLPYRAERYGDDMWAVAGRRIGGPWPYINVWNAEQEQVVGLEFQVTSVLVDLASDPNGEVRGLTATDTAWQLWTILDTQLVEGPVALGALDAKLPDILDDAVLDGAHGALLADDTGIYVILSNDAGLVVVTAADQGDGNYDVSEPVPTPTETSVTIAAAEWLPDGLAILVGRAEDPGGDGTVGWVGLLDGTALTAEHHLAPQPGRYAGLRAVDVGPDGDVFAVGYQDGPVHAWGEPWIVRLDPNTLEILDQTRHGRGWDTAGAAADRLFDITALPGELGGAIVVGTKEHFSDSLSRGWELRVNRDLDVGCGPFTGCAGDAEWWEDGAAAACDDGDPCTADSCVPAGCRNVFLHEVCDLDCNGTTCPRLPGYRPVCNDQSACEYRPIEATQTWQLADWWVYVPPGSFDMGNPDVQPLNGKTIFVNNGYFMQKWPLTVDTYEACMADGSCDDPLVGPVHEHRLNTSERGRGNHPQNYIDRARVEQACSWLHPSASPPSETQWRYAANGTGQFQKWPWGISTISCGLAVIRQDSVDGCGVESTAPIGRRPAGVSPFGVAGMVGNVWEITADCWNATLTGHPGNEDPWLSGDCATLPILGGGFGTDASQLNTHGKATRSQWDVQQEGGETIGGRCVRPLPDPCAEREVPCEEVACLIGGTCQPDGSCVGDVLSGSCFIDDVCYGNFDVSPDNPCEACFATGDQTVWSDLDGAACDDDATCSSGTCDGDTCELAFECEASTPCLDRFCVPGGGCSELAVDCDDGDACTVDSCDLELGCQHEPADCTDGNPCTDDLCDPATGCAPEANDFDPCTGDPCDDGNPCTADVCEFSVDACFAACSGGPDDALECDSDGLPCTVEACSGGDCLPTGTLLADTCFIDGACYDEGEASPDEHAACRFCESDTDAEAWTSVPFAISCGHPCEGPGGSACVTETGLCVPTDLAADGTLCDEGLSCVAGECVGCGVLGTPCPSGFECVPSESTLNPDWSYCRSTQGTEAVFVPGGTFYQGCNTANPYEASQCSVDEHVGGEADPSGSLQVDVPAFAIMRTEVTGAAHGLCGEPDGCLAQAQLSWAGDLPAAGMNRDDAAAYCIWLGEQEGLPWQLCSESEWEKAARGGCETLATSCDADLACCQQSMRVFPWGDSPLPETVDTCELAVGNWCATDVMPQSVEGAPDGASPYGVRDMAGNISEWVGDCWHGDGYTAAPADGSVWGEPCGAGPIVPRKGGSYTNAQETLRPSGRQPADSTHGIDYIGFRCCRSLAP